MRLVTSGPVPASQGRSRWNDFLQHQRHHELKHLHITHHTSFIVSNHGVVAARHTSQLCDFEGHVKAIRERILT